MTQLQWVDILLVYADKDGRSRRFYVGTEVDGFAVVAISIATGADGLDVAGVDVRVIPCGVDGLEVVGFEKANGTGGLDGCGMVVGLVDGSKIVDGSTVVVDGFSMTGDQTNL